MLLYSILFIYIRFCTVIFFSVVAFFCVYVFCFSFFFFFYFLWELIKGSNSRTLGNSFSLKIDAFSFDFQTVCYFCKELRLRSYRVPHTSFNSFSQQLWNMTFHLIKFQFNSLNQQIWTHGKNRRYFDGFCENTNSCITEQI